jgi:hypothetical protein
MAKIEFDSILRCANVNCVHNRDGYNCTCNVVTLNADGQCALVQPRRKSTPPNCDTNVNAKVNKPYDIETSK